MKNAIIVDKRFEKVVKKQTKISKNRQKYQ